MYTRKIKVNASDVSANGRIKLRCLLDYFQDTAGLAVEHIEGTATELMRRGYAWVLARYEINFLADLPMLDDEFTLTTYHDPSHGYNTLRMFHASFSGTEFVRAKTSWLLIDINNKKPVKPAVHLPEITSDDVESITPDFIDIPEAKELTQSREIPVNWHDLDYNGHVNNAVYFEWVHDFSPVDFMNNNLKTVCASFRSGAKLAETLTLERSNLSENIMIFSFKRQGLRKPSANFYVEWHERM